MIYSLICILLAAVCNSQMDNLKNKFSASKFWSVTMPNLLFKLKIFKTFQKAYNWLDAPNSWRLAYINGYKPDGPIMWSFLGIKFKKPSQIVDGWHFIKMWMQTFIFLALVLLKIDVTDIGLLLIGNEYWALLINFNLYGLAWFIGFQGTLNTK